MNITRNKRLRESFESELVGIVEKKFPKVSEVQYDSRCAGLKEGGTRRDYYFLINKKYDSKLDDALTSLELKMYRQHKWNLALLQFPSAPRCERLVYRRE